MMPLMSTMNVSLPEQLKAFAEIQVNSGQYGSASEYVRELIRRDQDRTLLRGLVLDGAGSPIAGSADPAYFAQLRSRASPGAP